MSFKKTDALLMAKISDVMYENTNVFGYYFSNGKYVDNSWTRCVAGYVNEVDRIVIAFRGSQNLYEWIDNANSRSLNIHPGFLSTCDIVWDSLYDHIVYLATILYPNKKIILTGHSRGGALAVLMATYAKNIGLSVDKVYTFGAPRVTSKYTSIQNSLEHYRVENKEDPVAVLPWVHKYKHTGN